ncbi:hypothetical protein K8R04_05130 [Candidatus Uhrbacteria bacterium]|nr:hypothetical protein [Candidatus Uhrbacteria bacterium]
MPLAPVQRVKEWWRSLPTETRFSTSILGVCGIVIIILSTVYMRSNVLSPFRVSNNVLKPAQELYARQSERANELEASKTKDTDRDGLSDYSELYVYRTSPYLGDTDSDGIPDAIEIAQASDPNCPAGTTCIQIANQQPTGSASSTFSDLIDVTQFNADPNMPSEIRNAQQFIQEAKDPSLVTPQQIRETLTKFSLVSPERLTALTDDEVRAVYAATYARILKIREASANAGVGAASTTTP